MLLLLYTALLMLLDVITVVTSDAIVEGTSATFYITYNIVYNILYNIVYNTVYNIAVCPLLQLLLTCSVLLQHIQYTAVDCRNTVVGDTSSI